MSQQIIDYDFDDASAWSLAGAPGTLSVQSSQARFDDGAGSISSIATVQPVVIGQTYNYTVDIGFINISSFVTIPEISFGGIAFFNAALGVGVFTGTFVATHATGLVLGGSITGEWYVNSVSIQTPAPIRERILQSLVTQVETITTANGYDLNLVTVDRARRDFTEAELPACGVFDNDEENSLMHGAQSNVLSVSVEAHSDAGLVNRSTHANDMIAALKKGIMSFDATFGGLADRLHISLVSTNYPQDDDQTVMSVSLVFLVEYEESIGNPYSNP